jgi:plastocyanin
VQREGIVASVLAAMKFRSATVVGASLYGGVIGSILSSASVRDAGAQVAVSGQVSIMERPGAKTNDLADAVVWLDARGAPPPTPTPRSQIVMRSREYVPRVRIVAAGSSVAFPNQDPFRHNVFSKSGPNEFDLGLYGRGETKEARAERPGVYPVFCNIHAKMVAYIVALPSSLAAQPNPDGRFSIANVPPGTYTLHVWHDRGGSVTRELTVAADGQPVVNVQLDARGYRFVQHKNKFGQEYTNAGRDRY